MESRMKTSIIIPTLSRPVQLRRNVERLLETVTGLDTEIIIVAEVNRSGVEAVKDLPVKVLFQEEWQGSVAGWNRGAAVAMGDMLVTGADDLWWHDGWLHEALAEQARTGLEFVGLNDCYHEGHFLTTHWLATRRFLIEHMGGALQIPAYKCLWADNEANQRAKRAGQFTWCKTAQVEHMHWQLAKAHVDGCYIKARQYLAQDAATFKDREVRDFPDDFAPTIGGLVDWRMAPGFAVTMAERELLVKLAGEVGRGVIVNIGMGPGASIRCLRAGAPEADLVGVEIDPMWAMNGPWQVLLGDSKAMAFDKPIDLLFVDGDHNEAGVRADIVNWAPRVKPGGLVAFHDYGNNHLPWCAGVKIAVDALMGDWQYLGDADSIRYFRRAS